MIFDITLTLLFFHYMIRIKIYHGSRISFFKMNLSLNKLSALNKEKHKKLKHKANRRMRYKKNVIPKGAFNKLKETKTELMF